MPYAKGKHVKEGVEGGTTCYLLMMGSTAIHKCSPPIVHLHTAGHAHLSLPENSQKAKIRFINHEDHT
jgi:hypothetical protein